MTEEKIAKGNKKCVENLMIEMEGQPAEDIIKVLETKLLCWMNSSEFWYKEFMAQREIKMKGEEIVENGLISYCIIMFSEHTVLDIVMGMQWK